MVPAQPKVIKNRQVDHARVVITLEENDHLGVAKVARDRECVKLGPICRQREDPVAERQRRLDAALQSVERRADPQTGTATQLVAWASFGQVTSTGFIHGRGGWAKRAADLGSDTLAPFGCIQRARWIP